MNITNVGQTERNELQADLLTEFVLLQVFNHQSLQVLMHDTFIVVCLDIITGSLFELGICRSMRW